MIGAGTSGRPAPVQDGNVLRWSAPSAVNQRVEPVELVDPLEPLEACDCARTREPGAGHIRDAN